MREIASEPTDVAYELAASFAPIPKAINRAKIVEIAIIAPWLPGAGYSPLLGAQVPEVESRKLQSSTPAEQATIFNSSP